jgi:hypothetical protein
VRAKTGEVPYRIELTCRKKSSHCRDPHSWLRTSASLISISPLMITLICHSRRRVTRDSQIPRKRFILANWLTRRPAKWWQETRASTLPRNQPSLAGPFTHFSDSCSPNSMGARAIWARRGSRSTNESIITNIREEKKVPAEDTRERSTPAPPEAEAPSGRHLKSNTTNNVIAPGSEVNLSRLRIRPNESHP